jgi:hypothetical protein
MMRPTIYGLTEERKNEIDNVDFTPVKHKDMLRQAREYYDSNGGEEIFGAP